jgi:MerR family transcriptional regulator, light-induced transcriptional regulator
VAALLSIGALSRATGIPVETLRTWERRYGFPAPSSREGNRHRRYPVDSVERLRRAVDVMNRGHKPSVALTASSEQLEQLLALPNSGKVAASQVHAPRPGTDDSVMRSASNHVAAFFAAVMHFDGEAFQRAMHHAWNELGAEAFAEYCAASFLVEVGSRWERGELSVAHEHFSSEHVRSFLATRWGTLNSGVFGPRVACATPEGEQHVLGLHLAATALAAGDAGIVFLGASTPVVDLVTAVTEADAIAAVLSASACAKEEHIQRYLEELKQALPASVAIIVGGSGFSRPPGFAWRPDSLGALTRWVRSRQSPRLR